MTSGFYNYLKLIGNDTSYARRMTRLSNRIFGNVVKPLAKPSHDKVRKLLGGLPYNKDESIVNYYPRHVETHFLMKNLRDYGLFRLTDNRTIKCKGSVLPAKQTMCSKVPLSK